MFYSPLQLVRAHPSTLQAYSSSGTGSSPFSVLADAIFVARSYSPEITDQMTSAFLISFASIIAVHVVAYILVKRFCCISVVGRFCFSLFLLYPSFTLFCLQTFPLETLLNLLMLLQELLMLNLPKSKPLVKDNERPDIFLVLWETFSGNYNSAIDNPLVDDITPNLKKFFEDYGVLYHELVTNACPTANSFWSLFNLGLPLSHGNTIIDTLHTNVDSIYNLINRSPANYSTLYTSAANPNFDGKDKWLDKNQIDDVFFRYDNIPESQNYDTPLGPKFAQIWNNDRILVDQVRERTDLISNNSPIFNWITSISTHNPYSTFDDPEIVGSPFPLTKFERYLRALNYSDKYLVDKMLNYFKSRNKPNTVVIFMGDHAAYKVPKLVPKCLKCPRPPFENDQIFYTTAVLGYLGDDDMRKN
ncbi:hypothetical protein GEMRC1_010438 [Eukaryota sp. GEM-RC1]